MAPTLTRVILNVSDLRRSAQFYDVQLGLRVAMRHGDAYAEYELSPGVNLGLSENRPVGGGGASFGLVVDDIQAAYRELTGRGVRFSQPPRRMPWGAHIAVFKDPDGYVFSMTDTKDAKEATAAPAPRASGAPGT